MPLTSLLLRTNVVKENCVLNDVVCSDAYGGGGSLSCGGGGGGLS